MAGKASFLGEAINPARRGSAPRGALRTLTGHDARKERALGQDLEGAPGAAVGGKENICYLFLKSREKKRLPAGGNSFEDRMMRLTLAIENHERLPDGGPLRVTIPAGQGLDIGRDPYLDWTLPDPNRFISGKHCEIRSAGAEFLLYDISTNGTYVNGSQNRVQSPYRLRSGDRLTIGQYIVAVSIDDDAQSRAGTHDSALPPSHEAYWHPEGEIAPPIARDELRLRETNARARDGWLEHAADLPRPLPRDPPATQEPPSAKPAETFDPDAVWAPLEHKPAPPPPEPQPLPPAPRGSPYYGRADLWSEELPAEVPAAVVAHDVMAQEAGHEPPPPPSAVTQDQEPEAAPAPPSFADFLASFAAACGVPPQLLLEQDAAEFGERLGTLVRLVTIEMKRLLEARSETRIRIRNPHQTTIKAEGNNPLKFSPTAEDALRIMFGPATRGYLDASQAFTRGFADLKTHELCTFAAMQKAVRLLAEDLDPATIESARREERGLAALIGSRKARLWDTYVTRWKAKTQRREDGLTGVFMEYFAECYDNANCNR